MPGPGNPAVVVLPTVHSGRFWNFISPAFYNHRNRRAVRERVAYASLRPAETSMRACRRPTEAVCFRVRKCAINRQLIVAGIQRFERHAYAARFRFIHTRKTLHALSIYTQTAIFVFFVHGNGHTHACLTPLHDEEICFPLTNVVFKRS